MIKILVRAREYRSKTNFAQKTALPSKIIIHQISRAFSWHPYLVDFLSGRLRTNLKSTLYPSKAPRAPLD
jgi:hypothetical protein